MRRKSKFYYKFHRAEEYGVRSATDLKNLGDRPVRIEVYIGSLPEKGLLPLTIRQREDFSERWHQRVFDRLLKNHPLTRVIRKSHYGTHTHFHATIPANRLLALRREKALQSIHILSIKNRKPGKPAPSGWKPKWFTVKARIAWQVEGQRKGMQYYEDQLWLIEAHNNNEAEIKFRKKFKRQEEIRFYRDLRFTRHLIEKITEVTDTMFDPSNAKNEEEVAYELKLRRMKPEYEWHPRRELLHSKQTAR